MSMELRGTHGGLLWWLLGYELVAWFGSTGLDLPIGIAAAINDLSTTWLPLVGSVPMEGNGVEMRDEVAMKLVGGTLAGEGRSGCMTGQ
jgi:hypothetical protein